LQANYRGTEYIGKLGLEQSYEGQLHGSTGYEEVETSAGGRAVRRIRSHAATPGNTLVLSVDMKLQQIVESLYGDRRGALVALDPRNGEVLAFVSKPTFDPNLFVDGIDADNWRELNESIDKPLLNRGLRGTYAPGSTYKPYMALAALTTGKRTPEQTIHDPGYFWFGNHKFRDDKEGGHGAVDMYRSIVQSCDTYYYMLANDLGVDTMAAQLAPFGFGQITGIDMEGELRGVLPSTEWKKRAYRKPEQQRWYAGETISLGIGQGYNSFTVLQMAQAVATLAAGGIRHKPHLVHEIVDVVSGKATPAVVDPGTSLGLKPEHLAIVHDAMVGVNREGTSATAFLGAAYVAAGKTGTAQVVGIKADEKYSASKVAEHLRDHALFIAYAPADKPTVALALVVENAGFGAQAAAPIARRVFDYLLTGQVPTDDDIAAVAQGLAPAPPRPGASAVAAAGAIAAAASGASAAVLSRPVAPAAVAARTPVAAAVR
jgi:penicillin-binding protein 2